MTTLSTKGDVDGSSVGHNQGMLKAGLGKIWQVISDLFGTDSGAMRTVHETLRANGGSVLHNLSMVPSLAGNALTMTVKTRAGAVPSAADPVLVSVRNPTAATGDSSLRQVSGALSLTISSTSTMGHVSGVPGDIYWYLVDSDGAGTMKLAASSTCYGQQFIGTTVAEGGAGAADSATAIYSDAVYANKVLRLVTHTVDTQATAGTWVTAPSLVEIWPFDFPVAAALGGGLQLIKSITAAGASSVDFTQVDGTFDEYVFKLTNIVPGTNATDLWLQVAEDIVPTIVSSAGAYAWQRFGSTSGGAVGASGSGSDTKAVMLSGLENGSGKTCVGEVTLLSPGNATYNKLYRGHFDYIGASWTSSGVRVSGTYQASNNAVKSVRFKMSSGTISGTIALYGVKK